MDVWLTHICLIMRWIYGTSLTRRNWCLMLFAELTNTTRLGELSRRSEYFTSIRLWKCYWCIQSSRFDIWCFRYMKCVHGQDTRPRPILIVSIIPITGQGRRRMMDNGFRECCFWHTYGRELFSIGSRGQWMWPWHGHEVRVSWENTLKLATAAARTPDSSTTLGLVLDSKS